MPGGSGAFLLICAQFRRRYRTTVENGAVQRDLNAAERTGAEKK
jgi:hypothetical protein